MSTTLEEAKRRLEEQVADDETPVGWLTKAVRTLGLAKGGSATSIIGHPGAPAEGVANPGPGRGGGNQYDEENPEGTPLPENADPEAGAAGRISSAREGARATPPTRHGEVEKAKSKKRREAPPDDDDDDDDDGGDGDDDGDDDMDKSRAKGGSAPRYRTAEELYKSMAALDGDGALAAAFEASTALERLTDVMVKAYAEQEERWTKQLDILLAKVSGMAEVVDEVKKSQATTLDVQENLVKAYGTMMDTVDHAPVRAINPGIGVLAPAPVTTTGPKPPEALTKSGMIDVLTRSYDQGIIDSTAVSRFMGRLDTAGLAEVWGQLPETARALVK